MSSPVLTCLPVVESDVFSARLAELERWLWTRGYPSLGMGRLPNAAQLADGVAALSDLYTVNRTARMGAAAGREHLPAKLLYFLISDAPKSACVLRELAGRYGRQPQMPADGAGNAPRQPLRVVDLGAGVGATSVGLLLSLDANQSPEVHIEGIDADAEALRLWRAVTLEAGRIAGVRVDLGTMLCDLNAPTNLPTLEQTDLFMAQAVLNELDFTAEAPAFASAPVSPPPSSQERLAIAQAATDSQRARWISQWVRQAATIVIEPALHDPTRALQRARDRLLSEGGVRVLAPCPHQQPCPMLQRQGDWCHEVRRWEPTPQVASVQAMTRRRDERTKFSFLAISPLAKGEGKPPSGGAAEGQISRVKTGDLPSPALEDSATLSHGEREASVQPLGDLTGRLVSDALNSKGKMERVALHRQGATGATPVARPPANLRQ